MNDQVRADVKRLRLAYMQAIATSDAAMEIWVAGNVSYRRNLANRHAAEFAAQRERDAGRDFLAALDTVDPACMQCGCTMFNPCMPPCGWVSMAPPLCSTCFNKEIDL